MKKISFMFVLGIMILCDLAFAGEIIRVRTMEVPPWGFVNEKGEASGVFSDIASAIAKEANLSFENKIVPYRRIMYDLETGDADLIMLYPNEKLKKIALPVAPLFIVENIVMGLKGTKYQSPDDLHGKTVGHVRAQIMMTD